MFQKNKNKIKYLAVTLVFAIVINISSLSFVHAEASSATIFSLTNASRSEAGLSSLSVNAKLASAALAKANDMFSNQYFAHTSPSGKTPWDFIQESGYTYTYAGENLAIGYSDNTELQNAWMNSPTHRENILNPNFREIGIATLTGTYEGAQTTIVVESFGSVETAQPVSQVKDVQAAVDTNAPAQSNAPAPTNVTIPVQKTFDIINEGTSFNPTKIFQGETVNFKVGLKGDIKEAYIMVGDQKIDFADSLAKQGSESTKNLVVAATVDKQGEAKVELTVVGINSVEEVKDMGILKVNAKIITNSEPKNSLLMSIVKNVNDYLQTYISIIAFLILVSMGYFALRQKKYGKFINFS